MEHTEGSGTTYVTGTTTDVRTSHGIRDATDCSPFRRPSPDTRSPNITRSGISRIVSTWSRLLQDKVFQLRSNGTHTRRLAAPNRIHPCHFDQTVGMTGRMAHSDTPLDPHRDSDHASLSQTFILNIHLPPHTVVDQPLPLPPDISFQLASQEADILTSAPAGDSIDQFPVPDREESGNTEPSPVVRLPITPTTIEEPI